MKGFRKFLMGIGTLALIGVVLAGCGDLFADPEQGTEGGNPTADNQLVITDTEDTVPTSVIAGGGQTFVVKYQGKTADVFWTVAGLRLDNGVWATGAVLRPDTTVSGTGVLSVSLDESAKKLRVQAALSADPSVVGWLDIDRLDASETTVPLLQQLNAFIKSGSVQVSEESITITGGTNTEITVPSNSALVVPIGAKLVITKGTTPANNPKVTISGKLIVKGELEVEDTVLANGRGYITVESGGVYTDGNDPTTLGANAVPFGFFLSGTTIVKGGGVLRTSDQVWNLSPQAGVNTFIGTPTDKGIIRLPPESMITIKVTNASAAKGGVAPEFDFQLDGLVVVRGGASTINPKGPWTLGVNDVVTVTAGSTLSLENTGELVLPALTVATDKGILKLTAAAGTGGAKIIGRGKITVNPGATATEIVGGDGGWQAVGDLAKKHIVTVKATVGTTPNTIGTEADSGTALPTLDAGTGATITQKAGGELVIASGLTINLGGTTTSKKGSIELEAAATGVGTITLSAAQNAIPAASIETGNIASGAALTIGSAAGNAEIEDVDNSAGSSTAGVRITAKDSGGDQHLASIGPGDVKAKTNGSTVELSSETLVTVQ